MAATAKYNIVVQAAASFERKFVWKTGTAKRPVNLTGWSALLHVRASPTSPVLLQLSTAPGGGLILGGSTGSIDIVLSAAQTKALAFTNASYDLLLIPPTGVGTTDRRLLEGKFTVSPAITVPA